MNLYEEQRRQFLLGAIDFQGARVRAYYRKRHFPTEFLRASFRKLVLQEVTLLRRLKGELKELEG